MTHQWDSIEWRKMRDKCLYKWFMGDQHAIQCFIDISTIVETWDDLIDKDEVTDKDINYAFDACFIHLPRNPFYMKFRHMLEPLIIMSVNAYHDSETLVKRDDESSRMMSFYIRNIGLELVPMIAFCIGGYDHMRKISMEARDFFIHETYEEWEHRHDAA